MSTFITLTLNGIAAAALLFMVAAGLSLIFGLMGVLNFAHGSFFLWGAYCWLAVFNRTGNFWLGLLAAIVVGAALGVVTERIFCDPCIGVRSLRYWSRSVWDWCSIRW
jgi:branched-chain amino acid transport system permease protein